jgi:hypothetical protein
MTAQQWATFAVTILTIIYNMYRMMRGHRQLRITLNRQLATHRTLMEQTFARTLRDVIDSYETENPNTKTSVSEPGTESEASVPDPDTEWLKGLRP